jgi:hypothetical protein
VCGYGQWSSSRTPTRRCCPSTSSPSSSTSSRVQVAHRQLRAATPGVYHPRRHQNLYHHIKFERASGGGNDRITRSDTPKGGSVLEWSTGQQCVGLQSLCEEQSNYITVWGRGAGSGTQTQRSERKADVTIQKDTK